MQCRQSLRENGGAGALMRLAYICLDAGVPIFGRKGCSVHVQELIRAFGHQGLEVELFAANLDGNPPLGLEGVPCHALPRPLGDRTTREQATLAANAPLAAELEQHGPYDLVYERHALWSFAAMEYAATQNSPGLLEVNAPLIEEQTRHRGLHDRVGAQRAAQRAVHAATVLLAVSDEMARYLERYPIDVGRIHVIPNGVSGARFPPDLAPTLLRVPDEFVVGFVGTLKPWHGLDVLVESFAALHRLHPGARLLIVGDGPQRPVTEQRLQDLKLAHAVRFTGAVDPDQVPGLIASMDVGVAPYPPLADFYFSPLKVYEYMAAGRPVIASGIGQLAELIEPGVNGLLCPAGDIAALTDAMARLYDHPALRHRLGQAARETVLRGHTWDQIAARVIALADNHGADVHGATIHRTLSH